MSGNTEPTPPWWMRAIFGRDPRRTLLRLGVTVICIVLFFRFALMPIQITGMSMEPTYYNGKVNFVNRLAYKWREPRRGDVVAIRVPGEGLLLKRIVGLPGERVSMVRGRVRINGEFLKEDYLRFEEPNLRRRGGIGFREVVLDEDHYFVAGDNRGITVSGPVPIWSIVGKVVL